MYPLISYREIKEKMKVDVDNYIKVLYYITKALGYQYLFFES